MNKAEFIEYFRSYLEEHMPNATISVDEETLTTAQDGIVKVGKPIPCPGPPFCPDAHCTGWVMAVVQKGRVN
jgi:hypothetical protein